VRKLIKQGRSTRVDNPVRSPFTKSKNRNRSEDRKSINRTEWSRILYGGKGREELQRRSGGELQYGVKCHRTFLIKCADALDIK
jgi:hypothetical protein